MKKVINKEPRYMYKTVKCGKRKDARAQLATYVLCRLDLIFFVTSTLEAVQMAGIIEQKKN